MSLSLGVLGIVLPILPTTPFLLLASACFLRSSPRLHVWLMRNRMLGSYIIAYRRFHAIDPWTRIATIALLWACITWSAVFVVEALWLRILLALIAVGVTTHLVLLKTLTAEMTAEVERERVGSG